MSDERMLMTHGSISILAGMLEELSMSMGHFKPGQNAGTCMIFVYDSALVTTHAVHNEQCKKTYNLIITKYAHLGYGAALIHVTLSLPRLML
jgi:hypothetical protein